MKAVVIVSPGGPEVLELREVETPVPGAGELLVRVAASGLNRADLSQREGHYPAPEGWPADIPGLEYAGTVESVGTGVARFRPGDRVLGIVGGGGYAEALTVPEDQVIRVPRGLSTLEAGAVPEAFLTAWDALVRQLRLEAGETVLIHAVGSGVGTAAIQIARAVGAVPLGTSRTLAKLGRARELGLAAGFDGVGGGWADEVLAWTQGAGVDVILDLVGASHAPGNLRVLGTGGRWIVVGLPGGREAPLDLRALMTRRASIRGTILRGRPAHEKAALAHEAARRLMPLFASGQLTPVLDGTFPPARADDAHRRLEANEAFGKIVLVWER